MIDRYKSDNLIFTLERALAGREKKMKVSLTKRFSSCKISNYL